MNETQAFERQAEGRLASVETSAAEGFMAPLHAHEADEAVQVLEGAITVYAGEESVRLQAGETFVVERGVAHTYRADSPQTRFVFTTLTRSASRYESFLRAAGPVAGDAGWSADEDVAVVAAVAAAARIFYLSQLGKYVPGSVWSILTQIELSREHKIPKRTNVAVGVLVIAIAVTSGLTVAALLLPFGAGATLRQYWWILPIIPVLLAGLHPRVIGSGLNLVLRLARREPLPCTPSWAGLGRVLGLQILVWLCLGLQAWVLLIGMGASPKPALPVAIGGYALAYSLGQMAIGFPAGAVVRDAALALALSAVVPGATALVVALLARVILTVVDLVLAGGQYLALRRSNRTRAFLLI